MNPVNRRSFLAGSMGAVATATALTGKSKGANDVIRIGVVGFNGQGTSHIKGFEELDGVEVVALCDVDRKVLEDRAGKLEKDTGRKIKRFTDVRELVEDDNIDAVSTATPNHWHALVGYLAMRANKDVYIEKPCSHNVFEGRQLIAAARKFQRICHHGTQGRSSTVVRAAIQFMREGGIGKIHTAKGLCYKWRPTIVNDGKGIRLAAGQSIGDRLDWNLWLGPARERDFSPHYVHYNWHWFWEFGNGDIGNQGVHQMDIARWGLGKGLPNRVQAMGGRFGYKDPAETPNTLLATFDYGDAVLQFEVRGLPTNNETGVRVGNTWYGSEGYLVLDGYGNWKTFLGNKSEPGETSESFLKKNSLDSVGGSHIANFIRAVRSRKIADSTAPIAEGHLSSALCHLANIAFRTGRTLTFDPKTETFPGDDEANRFLTRDYRTPFVVPEAV
jgi:predicted dehydrogenase